MIRRFACWLLGDRGRPAYSTRRLVSVVTLELCDTGEIAIPVQHDAGTHRLPRGAAPVAVGERRGAP